MDKELEPIEINFTQEKIETEERKEEYNMIYGIYKKRKNCI